MLFSGSAQKPRSERRPNRQGLRRDADFYDHNLQFYTIPPTDIIGLEEFETLAIDRLKILKSVESVGQHYPKWSDEYTRALAEELKKSSFKIILHRATSSKVDPSEAEIDERRKDHISHFILRLAFCRTPDLRNWFIQQEVDLFRLRFQNEGEFGKEAFLTKSGLKFTVLSEGEKSSILSQLNASAPPLKGNVSPADKWTFYKVHFTEALDLIRYRKVYLQGGFAFVPENDLITLITARFRSNLSQALSVCVRYIDAVQEEARLKPILRRLGSATYTGHDYSNRGAQNANAIAIENLDSLSVQSFPLCMRQLHTSLRQHHHLKHGGRMQYGLFLKGIGISLEDSLRFWRTEFTKTIEQDKFDKQYAYNIRHNYGKEGKRTDYTPYSCVKIIMSNQPGSQDSHGCPFKHTDQILLRQRLEGLKLNSDQIRTIMSKVDEGQYNLACSRFFEFTHQIPENALNQVISHPNQYFDESQAYLSGKKKVDPNADFSTKAEYEFSQTKQEVEMPDLEEIMQLL